MSTEVPSIPFERLPEVAAHSHKSQNSGDVVEIPTGLTNVEGDCADLSREGGAFLIGVGRQATLVTVRHPTWRCREGNPTVHTSDVMIVHGYNTANSNLNDIPRVATEFEGSIIDKTTSEPISIAQDDDPHPELFLDCREETTEPAHDMADAAIQVYEAFKRLWQTAYNAGGLLYSGSNLAHRRRMPSDINTHPYVKRITRVLGARNKIAPGAESFTWLDGTSVQTHVERALDLEAGAFALNTHSVMLSPITMGLTAASPFAQGEYLPKFIGPYASTRNKVGYMATRFLGRMIGSPEAGPLQQFMPGDAHGLALLTNQRMQEGAISNPGRIGGQHADVRMRTDLPPHGTHELCAKDTAGGHIESIMSIAAFERSFMYVVESARKSGRIEALAKQYPLIIAADLYEREADYLAHALLNSEAVAIKGMDAQIVGFNGEIVSARVALTQAMRLVNAETERSEHRPLRLSREVYQWLGIRSQEPNYAAITSEDVENGQGIPGKTISRYYNGEGGTLSHYLRNRVSQLILLGGLNTPQAIAQAQIEAAHCQKKYLDRVHPEKHFAFLKNAV